MTNGLEHVVRSDACVLGLIADAEMERLSHENSPFKPGNGTSLGAGGQELRPFHFEPYYTIVLLFSSLRGSPPPKSRSNLSSTAANLSRRSAIRFDSRPPRYSSKG